jgi:hypothetical protein
MPVAANMIHYANPLYSGRTGDYDALIGRGRPGLPEQIPGAGRPCGAPGL